MDILASSMAHNIQGSSLLAGKKTYLTQLLDGDFVILISQVAKAQRL